ncbi:putative histone acetyltransferase mst2 [Erysiphe neolycopersici]|uniref:Histone acetyltransferase n=1 Tax=Erysiphe neolycopersici TaxID=212602 RepID=A0A420I477_9PEZI|nr:putative histone acetyltransferase mst2 [Erysiphe neolycopersici]
MAGQRRGIDTSEDDADYEEDDEILVRKHTAGRRITKNQPYHDIAENHGDVIFEHTDEVVNSDEKSDGHHSYSHQRIKRKCEIDEQLVDDEYEKKRNSRKLHSDNDPSEEFEMYLACGICGDNAHRQCARNANALQTEDGNECLSNNLVPKKTIRQAVSPSKRRITSRDKSTDSLQATHGRLKKNNSHAASNQKTLPEGSKGSPRLLRKRRNSCTISSTQETNSPRTRSGDKNLSIRYRNSSFFDEDYWKSDEMEIDTPRSPLRSPVVNGRKILHNKSLKTRSHIHRSSPLTQEFARIIERTSNTLKIAIKIDTAEVASRLSHPPKSKKKRRTPVGTITTMASSNFVPSTLPQSFYSLHETELDEFKSKPYGGILTEEQADTTLTMPKPEDRQKFDEARQKAEEDWKSRVSAASEAASIVGNKKSRKFSELTSEIEYIEFGKFQIDVWYDAPYPEEYSRNKALFICEYCLKYMESDIVAWRHTKKCPWKTPPGDEIYRDGNVAVFEVDGRKNTLYCQNLCLLAKLFLGSKTLYYDVEPFLFYVMTEYDQYGCHFVGYFSKEKRPSSLNNVSCILVLPIHQQKGYGHLLIDFSYLLTRVEKKTGSPEKPLSDMGLVSYRNYWRLVLCRYLKDFKPGDKIPSIREISESMGLTPDDVISALDALGTLIRDPITGTYAMKIKPDYYQEVFQRYESRKYVKLNPKALFWTPFLLGRGIEPSFDYISLNKIVPEDEHESKDSLVVSPTESKKPHYDSFMCCHEESNTLTTKSLGKMHTGERNPVSCPLGDDLATIRANLNNSNNNNLNLNTTTTTTSTSTITMTTSTSKTRSYYEAAALIPPTRFEVFPPVRTTHGGRGTPRVSSSYSRSNTSRKRVT